MSGESNRDLFEELTPEEAASLSKFFRLLIETLPKEEFVDEKKEDISDFLDEEYGDVASISSRLSVLHSTALVPILEKDGTDFGDWECEKKFLYDTQEGNIERSDVGRRSRVQIGPDEHRSFMFGHYYFYKNKESGDRIVMTPKSGSSDRIVFCYVSDSEIADDFMDDLQDYVSDNIYFKGHILEPKDQSINFMDESEIRQMDWDDIVLEDEIKDVLQLNLVDPILRRDEFIERDIPLHRGVIMHGKPGVGKTLAAKVICSQILDESTVIWPYGSEISDPNMASRIFDMAQELQPSLIILEDIDIVVGSRDRGNRVLLQELLQRMEGLKDRESVSYLATTNDVEAVDEALSNRPGRFDRIVKLEAPDAKHAAEMVKIFVKNRDYDLDIPKLGEMFASKEYTGAQINEIIEYAYMMSDDGSIDMELVEDSMIVNEDTSMGFVLDEE